MRLFIKLMVLVLALALAGPFFIKGPDGQPLLTTGHVKQSINSGFASAKNGWRRMTNKAARSLGDDDAGKTTLYKWQDESGQWHYASEPPPDQPAQAIRVDPNVNIMESSGSVGETKTETETANKQQQTAPGPDRLPQVLPTPGRLKNAVNKTLESRDQLEQRNEKMKEALIDP